MSNSVANRRRLAVTAALALGTIRQLLVLSGIARSCRFLQQEEEPEPRSSRETTPVFHIVLPVLREAAILDQTLDHFAPLAAAQGTLPIVVTNARETTDQRTDGDTVRLAREAAAAGRCIHLHHSDPAGLKADQLNQAAEYLLTATPPEAWTSTFLVCYDADSRPAGDPLANFTAATQSHPDVDVFHQSSRFELRQPRAKTRGWWHAATVEAGALRANRFVLAYELPRLLNRSPRASVSRRRAGSLVYSHVTGHGLCIRLSLLRTLPFPARSPLEDMHYSFILGSHGHPVVPLRSLDNAEVPPSLRVQVEQAARWFAGPGRFAAYLRDPQTQRGFHATAQAASAALISAEWLSCAVLPAALPYLARSRNRATRIATTAFGVSYAAQLLLTDLTMEPGAARVDRIRRLIGYPLACELFGIGGLIGAVRLARGVATEGKTERGPL